MTTQTTISSPLQPCGHDDHSQPAEIGFPRPTDAPKDSPDTHVLYYRVGTEPSVDSVVQTTVQDYTGPRSTDWLVVGRGEASRCTGVQQRDFHVHKAGTVYHAPLDLIRVYLSPVWLVNRQRAARASQAQD